MDDAGWIARPVARAAGALTRRVKPFPVAPLLALVLIAGPLLSAYAQAQAWEKWQHLEGVVDIGGPRADGNLVVLAAGSLSLVSRDGAAIPFARGADGFSGPPDAESYFAVAPALPPQSIGCGFVRDEVFILDLTSPVGVIRIDSIGHASRFATIPNVDFLSGIAFDTTGGFGFRLLITGQRQDRTTVMAVDCQGGVSTVTDAAPAMEGGLAVAPAGFGSFSGDLIGADELTGRIWAVSPDGTTRLVAVPDLHTGGDTGVESLGFVPPGFENGGFAYLADRGTPDNPFLGSDSILRLSSQSLTAAGVQTGDLLVATEGDGLTVAIHCESSCSVRPVAEAIGGHIEGHVIFSA